MKIGIGQRFDLEIDREDLDYVEGGTIIATWYHMGNPIYIELSVNKSMMREITRFFERTGKKTALFSITRVSKAKYVVEPTLVLLNKGKSKEN
ncbi:MAG: hypothetical protein AAE977_07000 [Thermoplasmataceae archaeon]